MPSMKVLLQRRQNVAWTNKSPSQVVLSRRTKVASSAGGWTYGSPANRPAQTFRLTPFKRRVGPGEVQSPDGSIADNQRLLIGRHDADVEKGDTFVLDDNLYEVNRVHDDRIVETIAVVDWKGEVS